MHLKFKRRKETQSNKVLTTNTAAAAAAKQKCYKQNWHTEPNVADLNMCVVSGFCHFFLRLFKQYIQQFIFSIFAKRKKHTENFDAIVFLFLFWINYLHLLRMHLTRVSNFRCGHWKFSRNIMENSVLSSIRFVFFPFHRFILTYSSNDFENKFGYSVERNQKNEEEKKQKAIDSHHLLYNLGFSLYCCCCCRCWNNYHLMYAMIDGMNELREQQKCQTNIQNWIFGLCMHGGI